MPARRLPATPESLAVAAEILRAGGLVAFPTDTVYGLGADATSDKAVERVFAAKGRPADKPLIVLVASLGDAARLGRFNEPARLLAEAFWPGALTLVLDRAEHCPLSRRVNPLDETVSLRVPGNETCRALLTETGRPLTAPSANMSGAPSPRNADEVARQLGSALDLILDGGPSPTGQESTIVDLTGARPRLLRAGAIAREQIEARIGSME